MNKKLLEEMNLQINKEIFSGYLYLAIAAYFENQNLGGFAHWMRMQAEEELEHGMKFFDFLVDRGEKVELLEIEKPESGFGSPTEVFAKVLEHEQYVTNRINLLYELAENEKDYATQVFLNWFVDEQVEEEKNASEILGYLKKVGDSGNALLMLDQRLKSRGED